MTLIATLSIVLILPPPAFAQTNVLGGIEEILDIINGAISDALDLLDVISQSLQALYQEIVWPPALIDEARDAVASLIDRFRGPVQSIYAVSVSSASLPDPVSLETIMGNRQTNDFSNLAQSFYKTFGSLPASDQADSLSRNMMDIDDGLALDTLKTLKATDGAGDLILESGNRMKMRRKTPPPDRRRF
jgi:hypothetical protein